MRRHLGILVSLCLVPTVVLAQADDDEGGRIERLIERTLSDEGRVVELRNFSGALSTKAEFDTLTISDDQGIWLEISDAVLDWDFSALLAGTLEVTELSATRISVLRQPVPPDLDLPSPTASGFRIPDLPVAVKIDDLSVPMIQLGEALFGTAIDLRLTASASLDAGAADIALTAERIDGIDGRFVIDVGFEPDTEMLRIATDLDEAPGGLVARALDLPGAPALLLNITGDGPLEDFSAAISLDTDGERRVTGAVSVSTNAEGSRNFVADIAGDLRPLLQPDVRAFFGAETRVAARGAQLSSGGVDIDQVDISSAHAELQGSARIADAGDLAELDVTGQLQNPGGAVVLPGSDVSISGADFSLGFDAATSAEWSVDMTARDIRNPVAAMTSLRFVGTGRLTPGEQIPFAGRVSLRTDGLLLSDSDLATALGPDVQLAGDVSAEAGRGFRLDNMRLSTASAEVEGVATANAEDGRFILRADAQARVPDIAAVGPLASPLAGGEIDLSLGFSADLPGGEIAVSVDGRSRDLDIGIAQLTPLLAPESRLRFTARRDATGTTIEDLSLENPELSANGEVTLDASDASFEFGARLRDLAALEPRLSGPVQIEFAGSGDPSAPAITGRTSLETEFATLDGDLGLADGVLNISADAAAPDLSALSELIAPLAGGRVMARLDGTVALETGNTDLSLDGTTTGLDIGQPQLDPLLAPETRLQLSLVQRDDSLEIALTTLENSALRANASLRRAGGATDLSVSARLAELGLLVAPLAGPAELAFTGELAEDGRGLEGAATASTQYGDVSADLSAANTEDAFVLEFDADAVADDLARLADLGAPLRGGRASLSAEGTARFPGAEFDVTLSGRTAALDIGQTVLDPLLRPETALGASIRREAGAIRITEARIENPALRAQGQATLDGDASRADLRARIADLGAVIPQIPGAVTLEADATDLLGAPQISAELASATGLRLQSQGQVGLPDGRVDITARGQAPLALAQPVLGARALTGTATLDLRLAGQPNLASLTGRVSTNDARLSDPGLGLVFAPIDAAVQLARARSQIDVRAGLNGGAARATGSVALAAPFATNLDISLNDVALRYLDVVQSTIDGAVTVQGPAANRISVAGDVRVRGTEIRVPDTGLGLTDPVPVIQHFNASPEVRQTIARARLPEEESGSGGRTGPSIPLDVTVDASEPIFVRGRGLDAEFAGRLRLGGTLASPIPVGRFELRRGRLNFLGQRLDLTEGSISAAGSLVPRLQIVATAATPDVDAEITLSGPADAPTLSLSSVPDLPEDEILAQILFGKSAASLSPFQVARLISSLAQLAGRGGDGVFGGTGGQFGFDDFDLRTDDATGEAELAIGQYVTENVYTEVELGAGGAAQVNLNLDLSTSTRLRSSVNSEGETGVGIFWQRDY